MRNSQYINHCLSCRVTYNRDGVLGVDDGHQQDLVDGGILALLGVAAHTRAAVTQHTLLSVIPSLHQATQLLVKLHQDRLSLADIKSLVSKYLFTLFSPMLFYRFKRFTPH